MESLTNMNKKLLILTILAIIVLVLAVGYFFIVNSKQSPDTGSEQFNNGNSVSFPEDSTQEPVIVTPVVSVRSGRDFLQDDNVTMWYDDPDTYLVDGGESSEGVLFRIFYFPADDSITVSLQGESLGVSRGLAEASIKERLALPEDVLCTLPINVTTPSWVSDDYSGLNLGLSFCPGSVPLSF